MDEFAIDIEACRGRQARLVDAMVRQQMSAVERLVGVVAYARIRGQKKRIGQIDAPIVAADDRSPLAIDRHRRLSVRERHLNVRRRLSMRGDD